MRDDGDGVQLDSDGNDGRGHNNDCGQADQAPSLHDRVVFRDSSIGGGLVWAKHTNLTGVVLTTAALDGLPMATTTCLGSRFVSKRGPLRTKCCGLQRAHSVVPRLFQHSVSSWLASRELTICRHSAPPMPALAERS
eukprot:6172279-Pleurochrysis_carterae.AAC.1